MAVPNVIYDADMSSDHDDVGDIGTIFGLQLLGEINIIGMGNSSTNGATALYMSAVSTYYGYPNIPVGVRPDVGGNGGYPAQVASEFPHMYTSSADCPLAANLYRQLLASSPDNSVVIVTGGFLDNVQALMQSGPDQYSSLTGMQLVTQKVRLLACAGGGYPDGGEFNFTVSPVAAKYVVNNWPTAATYVPDDVGRRAYTGGLLPLLPNHNPIREVYVDLDVQQYNTYPQDIGAYPYPSWTQQTIVQAFRGNYGSLNNSTGNFWNPVTYGYNHVYSAGETDSHGNTVPSYGSGENQWLTDHDVSGAQEQEYFEDQAAIPITDSINALMNLLPSSLNLGIPGSPSDVRATVASGSQINLTWIKNSYDETGFIIEKFIGGSYTQIGTVGAGVTSFSATGLSATANVGFRVKAVKNGTSSYAYAYVWVYSGWTEYNLQSPSDIEALYLYYQTCGLRFALDGDHAYNHIVINNDSTHGQTLMVNVLVGSINGGSNRYLYFFFQDKNNWYRVNHSDTPYQNTTVLFEKCINGSITTVGTSSTQNQTSGKNDGSQDAIGNGSPLRHWQLFVTPGGSMTFYTDGVVRSSATDTFSFSTGKIGFGGAGDCPVWQNFNFDTSGTALPAAPTNISVTAANKQNTITWTAGVAGVSYNVYCGTSAGAENPIPIARAIYGTSYVDTAVTNGTTYYYTVKAVNALRRSSSSSEASATPAASGSAPIAPTGLVASGGNAQVSLNWNTVSGATSYNVYRGTSSGGEGTTAIATGLSSANYNDTGRTAGTTYFYTVAASNASGISAQSSEASATATAGSAPLVPTNLTASSGNGQIVLNWTAVSGATSYTIYRGTSSGGEGATPLLTGLTTPSYTNTGLTNGSAYYYTVAAVNSSGMSANSTEASATPVASTGGPAFTNPSFETPVIGGYSYSPTGSGWTFTNNAGIQHNGSAYTGSTTTAPDGTQTALLQGTGGTLGTMAQSVSFPAGTYTISFYAAARNSIIQPVQITVDGAVVGTYSPSSNNFAQLTTASFRVTAGYHMVSFAATDSSADKTTFIDLLSINTISGGSGGNGGGGLAGSTMSQSIFLPLALSRAQSNVRTGIADSNYTATATDSIIGYTAIAANRTVNLPAAGTPGREIIVKDESGSCASGRSITIVGTIDGGSNISLTTSYATAALYDNGTNWSRII